MTASCYDYTRTLRTSSIDLRSCVKNNYGALACQAGDYIAAGCTNCVASGTTLECRCPNKDKVMLTAQINLRNCIGNMDGKLYCAGH